MPPPLTITQPKQILVEGKDAASFFVAFLSDCNLTGFQIQDFGGINELRGFLKALKITPGFVEIVTSLAVIRDAESDPTAAFNSVCTSLSAAGLPVPTAPANLVHDSPKVGIYILPDPRSDGMLETLCLRAVSLDPVAPCLDLYFNCLREVGHYPTNMDKARFQAFLASRPRPGLLIGHAANAGFLNFGSNEYDSLRLFLANLWH